MAIDGLDALFSMLRARLNGAGVWDDRVYQDGAVASAINPYVVFFWAAGGAIEATFGSEVEEYVISVKVVADKIGDANLAPSQIKASLRKQGTQQTTTNPLNGGDDWEVVTCFVERAISIYDPYAAVKPVWHRGNQYAFRMEAT